MAYKKTRVLHLLCSNIYSGAENVACQIIQMFSDNETYEMFYCSPDGQIRQALKERNITFVPVAEISITEIRRIIREVEPDIIHAHDMKASFFAALTCNKIPLISHIHNNSFESQRISVKSFLYKVAARKAKHIFWVSKAAFDGYVFQDIIMGKSSILYNIVDAEKIQAKAKTDCRDYDYDIVYVGRLTYPKNPQRLVKVLSTVCKNNGDAKIAIIGTGELENEVQLLINNLRIENNISLLGYSSNPYKIMQSAKVMIMTSRWEGLPMCALEATALGLPIVSTPTDGLKELIDDGKTGFLSDIDDMLAEKCNQILSDEALYREMHHRILLKSKNLLNVEKYYKQVETVYRESLK